MTFTEPSSLEVKLTLFIGNTLARPFYRSYVNQLSLRGDETVLDFGSGSGVCTRFLARRLQKSGHLTCVDRSQVWMSTIQRTLRRFTNIDYRLGPINELDLPDQSYDAVFIHFVLHDIPAEERPQVVYHLARVLKPAGKVFIREPLDTDGISVEELRGLWAACAIPEIEQRTQTRGSTDLIYRGVYQKPA